MATKEDILEQLVGEFLVHRGYFVRHNIKFLPRKDHPDWEQRMDSNHSDIDVLAINPRLKGPARVLAVSCKSWQSGFNLASELRNIEDEKVVRGKEAWKSFRELVKPKWSEAFCNAVKQEANCTKFTYALAVSKLIGDPSVWENHPRFTSAMEGNPIKIITFKEILTEVSQGLNTTLAATEVGRMLQLVSTAGITLE